MSPKAAVCHLCVWETHPRTSVQLSIRLAFWVGGGSVAWAGTPAPEAEKEMQGRERAKPQGSYKNRTVFQTCRTSPALTKCFLPQESLPTLQEKPKMLVLTCRSHSCFGICNILLMNRWSPRFCLIRNRVSLCSTS